MTGQSSEPGTKETTVDIASARNAVEVTATIEKEQPSMDRLEALGVLCWDVATEAVATIRKTYERAMIVYVLQGEATIETPSGQVAIEAGDLVTLPLGLQCTWNVTRPMGTHFSYL